MAAQVIPFQDLFTEQIGDTTHHFRVRVTSSFAFRNTDLDLNKPDYAFWDRARRGREKGLELAGLLIKPIGSKISAWVLGRRPKWQSSNDKASQALNDWWAKWNANIVRGYNESLDLGDCYLVLNGDLSLTVVPPNMVKPIVAEDDNQRVMGWAIRMTVPNPDNPTKDQIIENGYTATKRWRIVRDINNVIIKKEVFPNVSGKIPVIHIANHFGSDEFYGRPEAYSILNALIRYGDVFEAALEGNIRQGRPTPVISRMGSAVQVAAFWDKFGKAEEHFNPETGKTEIIHTIHFDPDELLTLGNDSTFDYKAPGSFSQDTQTLLNLIFYLILQHTEIPEFVWGAAIGSSKASAEAQLEPFLKFILKRRGDAMEWIQKLADLVISYMSIYDPSAKDAEPVALWRPIASADGRLTLDAVIWANKAGLMDDETSLWLLPVGIEEAEIVLAQARAELKKKAAAAATAAANAPQGTSVPGAPSKPGSPAQAPPGSNVTSGGNTSNSRYANNPTQPTEHAMADPALEKQDAEVEFA